MADTVTVLPAEPSGAAASSAPNAGRRTELSRSLLALIDQACVSGVSFVTTILLGRFGGEEQLGLYSLGFTLLVVLISLQDALITAPFTVLVTRKAEEARGRYLGHVLLHHLGLVLVVVLVFALSGLLQGLFRGWSSWVQVQLMLAVVSPCVLLREFVRRITFADQNFAGAVILDGAVAGLQILGLGMLTAVALIQAVPAFAVIGLASVMASGVLLWRMRSRFETRREGLLNELANNWNFGRWLAAGQMVGVIHGFVVYWLLGLILGPVATGNFAACMTIVMLSNPLILGLGNALGPRLANAASQETDASVRAMVSRSNLMMGGAMGLFAAGIVLFGEMVLVSLYGPAFVGNALTMDLLALAFLVGSLSTATDYGLRAVERTDLSFFAGSAGLAVTVTVSLAAIGSMGVAGCALGYLLGCCTTTVLRLVMFRAIRVNSEQEAHP